VTAVELSAINETALREHKAAQEEELAEAERQGIAPGQFNAPRREVDRSGIPGGEGATNTKAGTLPVPDLKQIRPTQAFTKTELLRLRASGIAITPEAERFLADEEEKVRDDYSRTEAQKRTLLESAPEIALAYETAYQQELNARETMLAIRADTAQARAAYEALKRAAMALGILSEITPVAPEKAREASLSHPDHARVHTLLRAEAGL